MYDKIHDLFPNTINADEESALSEAYNVSSKVGTKEDTKGKTEPKVVFPLISIWRTENPPNQEGSNEGNYPAILRGRRFDVSNSNGFRVRTFPISITYQVSIWSDKRVEVDDIYAEFLMLFFVDEPYIRVRAVEADFRNDDTGDKEKVIIDEEFSIQLEDSSTTIDTTSFSDRGRMYRQDIIISIDNAKLFFLGDKSKIAKYIPLDMQVIEK